MRINKDYLFSKESSFDDNHLFWGLRSSFETITHLASHDTIPPSSRKVLYLRDVNITLDGPTYGSSKLHALQFSGASTSYATVVDDEAPGGDIDDVQGERFFTWYMDIKPEVGGSDEGVILEYSNCFGPLQLRQVNFNDVEITVGDNLTEVHTLRASGVLSASNWTRLAISYKVDETKLKIVTFDDFYVYTETSLDVCPVDIYRRLNASGDVRIGASYSSELPPFKGKIGCIQFFNGYLLKNYGAVPQYCDPSLIRSSALNSVEYTKDEDPSNLITERTCSYDQETTEFPTTEITTTDLQSTEKLSTEKLSTVVSTAESSTDSLTTAEIPTTEMPASEIPTSEMPTSEIPTSEMPTSEMPTSEMLTTEMLTTEMPTSEMPTSGMPTSEMPTSEIPTTEIPTSEMPTSEILTAAILTTTGSPETSSDPPSLTLSNMTPTLPDSTGFLQTTYQNPTIDTTETTETSTEQSVSTAGSQLFSTTGSTITQAPSTVLLVIEEVCTKYQRVMKNVSLGLPSLNVISVLTTPTVGRCVQACSAFQNCTALAYDGSSCRLTTIENISAVTFTPNSGSYDILVVDP